MNADVQTSGLTAIVPMVFLFFFFLIAKVIPRRRLRGKKNMTWGKKHQEKRFRRYLRGILRKKTTMRCEKSIKR